MTQPAETRVTIPLPIGRLDGTLVVPAPAAGVIMFAHGSDSKLGRTRNEALATALHQRGLATLHLDLLTPAEDSRQSNRFNVDLLAERLELASTWLAEQDQWAQRPIGYFGVGIGAATVLRAAAHQKRHIAGITLLCGRPDLAGLPALSAVTAPTLALVGGRDTAAIALNREALARMTGDQRLIVVAGATQTFAAAGTLEQAAREAADWFSRCLAAPATQPPPHH